MADFCRDCFAELFSPAIPPEQNDLRGFCAEQQVVNAICEGCGSTNIVAVEI